MANRSKAKGGKYERELVELLTEQGFEARRVYASGAVGTILHQNTGNSYTDLIGDVQVKLNTCTLTIEVKFRKHKYPQWMTTLDQPTFSRGWLLFPGPDIKSIVERKNVWMRLNKPIPETIQKMLGKADILALRFPKNRHNPTGWLLLMPENSWSFLSRNLRTT